MKTKIIYTNSLSSTSLHNKEKSKETAMNVVRSLMKLQHKDNKGHGKNTLLRLQNKIAKNTLTENEAMIALLTTYNYKHAKVIGPSFDKRVTNISDTEG
jgi:hypothetical protein